MKIQNQSLIFMIYLVPPDDAPNWSYVDQLDMVYDTEYTDDLNIDDEDLDAILEDKADKSESFMQED
ncbi:unnamed protein product [Rhizophagus irregularis]|nr:unnamed protein product [Rhizophagus irregularis]